MSKGKLAKFADMERFPNVFQYPYSVVSGVPFAMRGHWRDEFFGNNGPIILELGCGRGEYSVGLARRMADANFVGVDIKGARMWTGAKAAIEEKLPNVAFLRTNIEIIDRFFAPGEVQEIWLTFSDPQMKNVHKRLTSTFFLERYRHFLQDGGLIHLKTDSNFLYNYTLAMLAHNHIEAEIATEDLYNDGSIDAATRDVLSIRTYYEQQWIDRGINIKYLRFRLHHGITLEESGQEIEFDDYRSYHRQRRSEKEAGE